MKSNKISTLRSNKISVFNCSGNICRIASPIPFKYGEKVVDIKASQGDYRLEIRGQYSKELPKIVSTEF